VVQGVGFRPFIKRLADRLGLAGTVANTGAGVAIEIETSECALANRFKELLRSEAPPASHIESMIFGELPDAVGYPVGYAGFTILPSAPADGSFTLISPDLATCADCLADIADPHGRRAAYPFTNCTNCGPRYSITRAVPYDRANTTMRPFAMCADCAAEYADVTDRRFHAEPIACPVCGPRLSHDLPAIRDALADQRIVAIKGLGGFQLACDAFSGAAVGRLRELKRRSRKPFAVMMRDLETVERFCFVEQAERELLGGSVKPIVLLRLREPGAFPDSVAPGLEQLGVMLPYTPLHQLLFSGSSICLIMTSGNLSEEPIVIANEEALRKLAPLSDLVVTHDRDIFMRVDDSVTRVVEGVPRILRRARGYAPQPISLPFEAGEILAVGPELKNTFCLTKANYAILSQHIGDLENLETIAFFEETLANLKRVYHAEPRVIAHDLHPEYMSTRWGLARPEPKIAVQHHHAHIASCMAENGLVEPVIGVAFDGTGYGEDGQIWGGEFLICEYASFERAAHLRYVPLVGGDRAAREPWRMAAAYLNDALGDEAFGLDLPCWRAVSPKTLQIIQQLLPRPALLTSSCGRLFDAVSSICGVSQASSYEGEAAILLEARAGSKSGGCYPFEIATESKPWQIDVRPLIKQIAHEVLHGQSSANVSVCFHATIAYIIRTVCDKVRGETGLRNICLSGGTFQNRILMGSTLRLLRAAGFEVFTHARIPANDGGISLGQAAVAAARLREGRI
jgi:hydrogenase maturation protein HypF